MKCWSASDWHSIGLLCEDGIMSIGRNEPFLHVGNIIMYAVVAPDLLAVVTTHRIIITDS